MKKKILITGASGFIGRALCDRLALNFKVTGIYHKDRSFPAGLFDVVQVDLTDFSSTEEMCMKHKPDVVIHCAAIAHQKIGSVDRASYLFMNSRATEKLAQAAARSNPNVQFIFLSSISVYGENNLTLPVSEDHDLNPTSDYGLSKLDAERRLLALADKSILSNLIILRLAPVYDKEWSFNLDRRVLSPMNLLYLKFGSGRQEMSALARPNLIDFLRFQIEEKGVECSEPQIFNVCDENPYSFIKIIQVFKNSPLRPGRPTLRIPLFSIYLSTRIAGCIFTQKREWLHACYEKLASSLIFANAKMLGIGFRPNHSLVTIFLAK